MKRHDPEEVQQLRDTLRQFEKVARKVSVVQAKLRESFGPPPTPECRSYEIPLPPQTSLA